MKPFTLPPSPIRHLFSPPSPQSPICPKSPRRSQMSFNPPLPVIASQRSNPPLPIIASQRSNPSPPVIASLQSNPPLPVIASLRSNLKNQLFLYSIILLFTFSLSCTTPHPDPRPATILITVSGECICNIFLYTPEGLCLQSKIYDCNETSRLAFTVFYEGPLTIKAERGDKIVTQPTTAVYNKTTEAGIIF